MNKDNQLKIFSSSLNYETQQRSIFPIDPLSKYKREMKFIAEQSDVSSDELSLMNHEIGNFQSRLEEEHYKIVNKYPNRKKISTKLNNLLKNNNFISGTKIFTKESYSRKITKDQKDYSIYFIKLSIRYDNWLKVTIDLAKRNSELHLTRPSRSIGIRQRKLVDYQHQRLVINILKAYFTILGLEHTLSRMETFNHRLNEITIKQLKAKILCAHNRVRIIEINSRKSS